MTSFSHIIPIDRNGFFCTSRQSLEASTADNAFTPKTPEHQPYNFHSNPNTDSHTDKKSNDIKSSAIVTPEKATEDSTPPTTQNSKAEVKKWARGMLKAEPCTFVTQAGLLLALKHNAPAPVIQFMLKINPNIMNFPKKGPTPLQVAVEHNADLDVVRMLLNASPVGECIRNAGFLESPLEYAKRCRSDRPDLIELLSRKSKNRDQNLINNGLDAVQMLVNSSPVGECIRNFDILESPLEYAKRRHSDRPNLIELLSRKSKRDQNLNNDVDAVRMLVNSSPVGGCIRNTEFPESPLECAKRHHSDHPDPIEIAGFPESPLECPKHRQSDHADPIKVLSLKSKIRGQNGKREQKSQVELPSALNLFSQYSSPLLQPSTKPKPPLLSPPPFSARRARARSIISSSSASDPSPSPPPPPPPPPKKTVLSEVKLSSNKKKSQHLRPISRSPQILPEKSNKANINKIDREELNNIKNLCALLWKSQRKMTKQMIACKNDIEIHSELLATMGTKDDILEELMKQQRSQMFRNWIALDIKERAYQSRLEKMEQRYIQQLDKRLDSWTGSMRLWNESTREQLQELRAFVDSEAETNEYFRNNMTDWIEKFTQDQENNTCVPSEVFATNLGEVNQRVPLCSGFRGAFCGHGTDTTDADTDPILGVDENSAPLKRVKDRTWRPLFKNRDYSAVE